MDNQYFSIISLSYYFIFALGLNLLSPIAY